MFLAPLLFAPPSSRKAEDGGGKRGTFSVVVRFWFNYIYTLFITTFALLGRERERERDKDEIVCHHTPSAAADGNANVDGNKSIGALNDERKYKLGVCYILKMKQIKGSRQKFQKFDKRPLLILFCWRGVDGGME